MLTGHAGERAIQRNHVDVHGLDRDGQRRRERRGCVAAASFDGAARACVVDEDLPHQAGGDAEEMRAPLPSNRLPLDQPDERLVHECARPDGMLPALAPQITPGEFLQLFVQERREPFERRLTAAGPLSQQSRELLACSKGHELDPFHEGYAFAAVRSTRMIQSLPPFRTYLQRTTSVRSWRGVWGRAVHVHVYAYVYVERRS
jgi:hypothetical protein